MSIACNCDATGSVNTTCQKYGGQCHCKPGVTGRMCDKCIAGFYNLSSEGCSGTVSLKKGKILQPFLQEEALTRGLEIRSIQLHRPCPIYKGL